MRHASPAVRHPRTALCNPGTTVRIASPNTRTVQHNPETKGLHQQAAANSDQPQGTKLRRDRRPTGRHQTVASCHPTTGPM